MTARQEHRKVGKTKYHLAYDFQSLLFIVPALVDEYEGKISELPRCRAARASAGEALDAKIQDKKASGLMWAVKLPKTGCLSSFCRYRSRPALILTNEALPTWMVLIVDQDVMCAADGRWRSVAR